MWDMDVVYYVPHISVARGSWNMDVVYYAPHIYVAHGSWYMDVVYYVPHISVAHGSWDMDVVYYVPHISMAHGSWEVIIPPVGRNSTPPTPITLSFSFLGQPQGVQPEFQGGGEIS